MAGFYIADIDPKKAITSLETPVLFIHGAEDDYIPPSHAQELYDAKTVGMKELWIAPSAKHAESEVKNSEMYDQKIGEFLDQVYEHEL